MTQSKQRLTIIFKMKEIFFFSDGTIVAIIVENAPGFCWENCQSVFKREIILYYIFSPLQSRTTTSFQLFNNFNNLFVHFKRCKQIKTNKALTLLYSQVIFN